MKKNKEIDCPNPDCVNGIVKEQTDVTLRLPSGVSGFIFGPFAFIRTIFTREPGKVISPKKCHICKGKGTISP